MRVASGPTADVRFAIDRMAKRTLGIHVLLGRLAESGSARAGGQVAQFFSETPSPHRTWCRRIVRLVRLRLLGGPRRDQPRDDL